jgi:hypothetical protein
LSEIKQVARKDPVNGAEGAVSLLERISPALENVDGSSGAIGTAVNKAIAELVPIVASAPADARTRDAWLERLWAAHEADQIPYIEQEAAEILAGLVETTPGEEGKWFAAAKEAGLYDTAPALAALTV